MARTAPGVKRTHLLRGVTLYKLEKHGDGCTERAWQYGNFYAHEYDALRKAGWTEWGKPHSKQVSNSKR
ncbi:MULTISPECIES: hypothetical protein [unclassified Exiguobacterium]|uniref:hypothetical protein n=1 Tax=unclassified Exiguobacterium TaxID=2644629 RepID=UPI0025C0D429|nr:MULTISPECIES: hypothetical protein [unclassified Exiguobacterium]